MTDPRPFAPAWGKTTVVANAAAATAAVVIPKTCQQIVLTNTSATATTFVRVTYFENEGVPPTGDAPTVTTDFPVPPAKQVLLTVGPGFKVIRTIASAADGNIIISPGNGT